MSIDATNWAWKQSLEAKHKIVLLSLADRAGENHEAYPSLTRLMQDTGISRRQTLIKILDELEKKNLIKDTGKIKGNGVKVYQLIGVIGRETSNENVISQDVTSNNSDTGTSNNSDNGTSNNFDTLNLSGEPIRGTRERTNKKRSHDFSQNQNLENQKPNVDEVFEFLKNSQVIPVFGDYQPNVVELNATIEEVCGFWSNKNFSKQQLLAKILSSLIHRCGSASKIFEVVAIENKPQEKPLNAVQFISPFDIAKAKKGA